MPLAATPAIIAAIADCCETLGGTLGQQGYSASAGHKQLIIYDGAKKIESNPADATTMPPTISTMGITNYIPFIAK